MPQEQRIRDLVARMKLIPVSELIRGKRLLFCDDLIVRGTLLKDTIQRLYDDSALEVHVRSAKGETVYLLPGRCRTVQGMSEERRESTIEKDGKPTPFCVISPTIPLA